MLDKPGALTHYANVVEGCGQQRGATVEIAQAELAVGGDRHTIYVAGINSSAKGFRNQQVELLETWRVHVAPCIAIGMKRAPHAEENIAAYLYSIGARGVRWSHAAVGAHFNTERGSRSYVCHACRVMVDRVGGVIEDPHNTARYRMF